MRRSALALLAGSAVALGAAIASADVIVLPSVRDNTLFESPTGALSNGNGPNFFVGRTTSGSIRRGLLAFDLALIPAGATITSATLTLNCSQTQGGASDIGLYRTLADWGEGGSASGGGGGAPATPGDATWLHTFFNTSFWSTPGGDFAPVASASLAVTDPGSYTWASTPDLVADLQGWLDAPATNFGWTLVGSEGANGLAKRFDSRENELAETPRLTIGYVVPAPSAAGVLAVVGVGALRRRRRS